MTLQDFQKNNDSDTNPDAISQNNDSQKVSN